MITLRKALLVAIAVSLAAVSGAVIGTALAI